MAFDALLASMRRRLRTLELTGNADGVFAGAALAEAVALGAAAAEAAPPGRVAAAQALGWFYLYRHSALPPGPESTAELAHAIVALIPAADHEAAVPEPLRPTVGPTADARSAGDMGMALLSAALGSPDGDLLTACVHLLTQATRHHDATVFLASLAVAHLVRYERGGPPGELDLSVGYHERALALTRPGDPRRVANLTNFGNTLRERYARTGDPADLDRAIAVGNEAVGLADTHPDLNAVLGNLGNCYLERHDRDGNPADLDRAIELVERSVTLHPDIGYERSGQLGNLCAVLSRRFALTASLDDLGRAIDAGEEAIAGAPPDNLDQPRWLTNLGGAYLSRHGRLGAATDLDRAVDLAEQALLHTPQGSPNRAVMLSACGLGYLKRHRATGAPADLRRATDLTEAAVACAPPAGPDRSLFLSNLADVHVDRYRAGGSAADLDRAISLGEQVVAAAAPDHPSLEKPMVVLGIALRYRFRRTGVAADLDRAIDLLERSMAIRIAGGGTAEPGVLSNLGVMLQERYVRTGSVADLDRAVAAADSATASFPEDHPERFGILSTAGLTYLQRFGHGGAMAHLDTAIGLGEQAVAVMPAEDRDRGPVWSDLGLAYFGRFRRTDDLADLERAVDAAERSVAATAPDDPDRARFLGHLATAYSHLLTRDDAGPLPPSVQGLARHVREAVVSSPTDRVAAGHAAGILFGLLQDATVAAELLDAAVAVLPATAPREGVRSDQEHGLGEHTGVVSDAVAAHCALGEPARAVEVAEFGRGILLGADLDNRTDLTELARAHPDLARRFRHLREQLDAGPPRPDPPVTAEGRRRLWAEHDAVLAEIRRKRGFGRFLQPPRLSDVRTGDTVVLLNAGVVRSDAIILAGQAPPLLVPLPKLTLADVVDHARELSDAGADVSLLTGPLKRQRVIRETLRWLWTSAVSTVLGTLSPAGMPHVCWLPIGWLGLFPLHAAGIPGEVGALDLVVSSYTPTLRALAYARSRPFTADRRQLTVALQRTPGLPDLPGCVAEAAALQHDHPDSAPLTDDDATTDRVGAALAGATWAHFACHAGADLTEPSRGGLRLHDGDLSISEIGRLRLDHAELAYLSACSTAYRGTRFADEVISLASAFQLAGFRHVVAGLWPLADDIAAAAARSFYTHLDGEADRAAAALHQVTLELRAQAPDRADLWASLIHSGPASPAVSRRRGLLGRIRR
ncbi:CHAT domain-containing protein [Actinoplanes sp. NPDC026623]|uniref:CHAT domain-containing protein n=1 Tax=Actinoplanes sp. NPDC026623 TaxID=3155610 RepID=UPI0033CC5B68